MHTPKKSIEENREAVKRTTSGMARSKRTKEGVWLMRKVCGHQNDLN